MPPAKIVYIMLHNGKTATSVYSDSKWTETVVQLYYFEAQK